MTVAVNDIVDKVELVLQDTTNVRWAAAELVKWLNDAQREIVKEKPEANVTTTAVQLSAGTKQALPTGGLILIDVIRNMGTDGTTAGNTIRIIDRRILDANVPDWHNTKYAKQYVNNYTYDENNPLVYFVTPPSDGNNYIEIAYSYTPSAASAGGNIGLADIYETSIIDFMLYRAYSKDADFAPNATRAIQHYQAFLISLGQQDKAEKLFDPNIGLHPYRKPGSATTTTTKTTSAE